MISLWTPGQQCAVIEAAPEAGRPVPGGAASLNAEVAALNGDDVHVSCPDIQRGLMRFNARTGWQGPFTDPKWRLVPAQTVTVPAMEAHEGMHSVKVTLPWICPHCGGPRGEVFDTISWDGSRRLGCHGCPTRAGTSTTTPASAARPAH